jgi:uncharacterized protein involved in exopolysaccharide biosynthesis
VRDWIETEEPLLRGAVSEIQRMVRRARNRIWLIILVAIAVTSAFVWKAAKKKTLYEASIAISIDEGSMSKRDTFLPVTDLRNYIITVLLSDTKLLEPIEANNWYPSRKVLGKEFAISELWDQTDVQVSRNFFLYEDEIDAPRSARIDITVGDADPVRAYAVADAVALIITTAAAEQQQMSSAAVTRAIRDIQASFNQKIHTLESRNAELEVAISRAKRSGNQLQLSRLQIEKLAATVELKRVGNQFSSETAASAMASLSEEISASGQDLALTRISEERPGVNPNRGFVLIASGMVVLVIALLLCVAIFGAYDTRVHDADDLRRLGLPIAGHFPSFPGDDVGALKSRGIATTSTTRRVPLRQLWR